MTLTTLERQCAHEMHGLEFSSGLSLQLNRSPVFGMEHNTIRSTVDQLNDQRKQTEQKNLTDFVRMNV